MDKEQKNRLKEEYKNRHPEMGIVCWTNGDKMWIARSQDTNADYNSTSFQLKLGSWRNRELQSAYKADPDSFEWKVLKVLDYKNLDDDHSEDLELLYMMCLDEYPDAMPMRPGKK